jgi:hypothetical protein
MSTAYEEIVQLAKALSARDSVSEPAAIANVCQQHPALYRRHCEEVRRGEVAVPETTRPRPVLKRSAAADAMLMIARGKLVSGAAKTMDEALCQVNREHPDLYKTHQKGD